MKTWFSSDTHFGHENIIKYCKRPFTSLEQMNETIIRNFNQRIKPEDTVFFLGDYCFRNSAGGKKGEGESHKASHYREQLNGNWIFIKGNHDCFSENVRLLTKEGYKKYTELKKGELIPTINTKTKLVEYKPISEIHIVEKDEVYKIKNKTLELEVSKNHQFLTYNYNRHQTGKIELKEKTADELWKLKSYFMLPDSCKSGNKKCELISDNELRLLAWILTDGHVEKNHGYISIYQSKPEMIKRIKGILRSLNLDYRFYKRKRNIEEICGKKLHSVMECCEFHFRSETSKKIRKLFGFDKIKKFPKWIHKLSDKQMLMFTKELIMGDGSIQPSGTRVLWKNENFLYNLMGLLVTHGISCNVITAKNRGFYLCIHKKKELPYGIRQVYKNSRTIEKKKSIMWDVTVPNHTVFVECNGTTCVTHNCNNSLKTHIERLTIRYGGQSIGLVHSPIHADSKYKINLVGHVHNSFLIRKLGEKSLMYNVGVDVHDFKPVSFDEIKKNIRKWEKAQKDG